MSHGRTRGKKVRSLHCAHEEERSNSSLSFMTVNCPAQLSVVDIKTLKCETLLKQVFFSHCGSWNEGKPLHEIIVIQKEGHDSCCQGTLLDLENIHLVPSSCPFPFSRCQQELEEVLFFHVSFTLDFLLTMGWRWDKNRDQLNVCDSSFLGSFLFRMLSESPRHNDLLFFQMCSRSFLCTHPFVIVNRVLGNMREHSGESWYWKRGFVLTAVERDLTQWNSRREE